MSAQAGFHGQNEVCPIEGRKGPWIPDKRVIDEKSPIIQMHRGTGWVVNKRNVVENISRTFWIFKGRRPGCFSTTKRPTYVLKDFPEDYIPIDKKTTTHHHYIWIQNILWARHGPGIHVRWGSMSAGVHVHWGPCQRNPTETFWIQFQPSHDFSNIRKWSFLRGQILFDQILYLEFKNHKISLKNVSVQSDQLVNQWLITKRHHIGCHIKSLKCHIFTNHPVRVITVRVTFEPT